MSERARWRQQRQLASRNLVGRNFPRGSLEPHGGHKPLCLGRRIAHAGPLKMHLVGQCLEWTQSWRALGRFIVSLRDVNEREGMQLVLELAYFLTVSFHLWVVAARGLHDLVDDQLSMVGLGGAVLA